MEKINVVLPEPDRDIMVTYKKAIRFGAYGDQSRLETVTKRGFYSKLFDNISIPPEWRKFKGVLLPHGWGGDHITIDKVIKWEYCEE